MKYVYFLTFINQKNNEILYYCHYFNDKRCLSREYNLYYKDIVIYNSYRECIRDIDKVMKDYAVAVDVNNLNKKNIKLKIKPYVKKVKRSYYEALVNMQGIIQ